MNFSKVKLIIILCLLIVNAVFALLCIRLVSVNNYISEEEAALAVLNLSKNGINVEFDKSARKLYDLPVYSVVNDEEKTVSEIYKQITEAFFGIKPSDSSYIKTPDGYIVSVKNGEGTLLGSSSLTDKMHIECSLEAAEYTDLLEVSKAYWFDELNMDKDSHYEIAEKFVSSALFKCGMKFVYAGTKEYSDGKIVCFSGELSDTIVPFVYMNIYVKNGKIMCCVGEVFDSAPEKKYSTEIIDSVDAVYVFSEYMRESGVNTKHKNIKIKNLSMTYDFVEYSYGEYYIIPSWIIKYSEKNGKSETVAVDAVTGENIRKIG